MPKRTLYACRPVAVTCLAVALSTYGVAHTAVQAPPAAPCAACIVFVVSPAESLLVSEPLNGLEILVRAGLSPNTAGGVAEEANALRAAMEAIRAAGGRSGLFLPGIGSSTLEVRTLALASRIVVDLTGEGTAVDDLAFRVKTALSDLRGAAPDAALGIAARPEIVAELLARDVTPYVDFVARPSRAPAPFPQDLTVLTLGSIRAPDAADATPRTGLWLVELPADIVRAQQLVRDVARVAPILTDGLIAGGTAEVRCGAERQATYLDPASLDTVAVVSGCDGRALAVTPDVPGVVRVRLSGGAEVIRVPAGEGVFAEDVRVVGARTLSVREIIARHQAAAAAQRREVQHLISSGSMTLTFEAPGFPAPLTISSEAVVFTAPDTVEIEQRDIRVNGMAFHGGGVPRLPLLEPERVASPPLAIALNEVYQYRLAGQEAIAGTSCYVVAFDPIDRGASLFSGRAWIAADTFAMVRVAAVQRNLRGPIVSAEQLDDFRREGAAAWLLARSEVRQLYEGPGHRTPIHRVLVIGRHEVNPADFAARRLAAHASPSVMLRDTVDGFRYLQRDARGTDAPPGIREVTGPVNRVRTVTLGAIFDPNIDRPLPFAGLSYVDFDLFGTGAQFNGFFGGTFGQLAVSVPSLAGTRWQVAGRASGILPAYNDRAFVDGREIYPANILQRPAHASMWLLRPLTPRVAVRAGYDFEYTHFARADSTAPGFTVPAPHAAHALRLTVDGQWAGWAASAWWAGAARTGWRRWGDAAGTAVGGGPEEYHPDHRNYQRHGLTLARPWIVSPRLVGRVEAAWMDGRDLDRFSRYAFGSFENRLRGYPAALIRYDRGGVIRGSAAWAVSRYVRLDGFLDTARVRDPGFGRTARNYTGVGAAAELPAPFGTLFAVEWGYGFQGIDAGGRRGTQVVRISGYKMF